MPVHPRIAAFHDDPVAWRCDIHTRLELGVERRHPATVRLHHPNDDLNDDLLPVAAAFFAAPVEQELDPIARSS